MEFEHLDATQSTILLALLCPDVVTMNIQSEGSVARICGLIVLEAMQGVSAKIKARWLETGGSYCTKKLPYEVMQRARNDTCECNTERFR